MRYRMTAWAALAAALLGPWFLTPCPAAGEKGKKTDKKLLAELCETAKPPQADPAATAEETRELARKRSARALELIAAFEAEHGKSPLLQEARSAALAAVGGVADAGVLKQAGDVATRLKSGAERGSDHAAQAELFLHTLRLYEAFRDAKTAKDIRATWRKHAKEIRETVAEYLKAYPKYAGADPMLRGLVRMAEKMEDNESRKAMLESVAAARPDHPLTRLLARESAVGKELDLELSVSGSEKPLQVKDLRGKAVVITFWASWCAPCRERMAALKKLQEKHGKDGLQVIGVCLDEKDEACRAYLKSSGIDWPQVTGDAARKLAREWAVETIPFALMVDRQGRLTACDVISASDPRLLKCLEGK